MAENIPRIVEFCGFRFNIDALVLYRDGQVVRGIEKQSLKVLAVLIQAPDQLASFDTVIEEVWPDAMYGVDRSRVNQHVSKLQKGFARFTPGVEYFENLRGRGYRFIPEVTVPEDGGALEPPKRAAAPAGSTRQVREFPKRWVAAGLIVATGILGAGFLVFSGQSEEDAVRQAVNDSQRYESLVLYRNPADFREEYLDRYWTPELGDNINFDRTRIRQSVRKLQEEGRRYGDETRCDQFDFQSIEINAAGDQAVVKTMEKWFIAEYGLDGSLIRNKNVGPYFVSYVLKKISGRWLIEKSTTARVQRPVPRVDHISHADAPISGRQFHIDLTGQDFEPELIHIEVVGPGCPESKPCRVPNPVLRDWARLTPVEVHNAPVTLSSGEFTIFVRNGDSQRSNPVYLSVP